MISAGSTSERSACQSRCLSLKHVSHVSAFCALETRYLMDMTEACRWLKDHGVTTVRLGRIGLTGYPLWRSITASAFLQIVQHDETCTEGGEVGWLPDLNTLRLLPWYLASASCLCERAGAHVPLLSPRALLERVVRRYYSIDLEPQVSVTLRFSCLQLGYGEQVEVNQLCSPLSSGENTALLAVHMDCTFGHLLDRIVKGLRASGFAFTAEGWSESEQGVYELTLAPGFPLAITDQATLVRDSIVSIFRELDLTALFGSLQLAPPLHGQICVSLWDRDRERNLFWDREDLDHMSSTLRHFLAGLYVTLPELFALYCPWSERTHGGGWQPVLTSLAGEPAHEQRITATVPNKQEACIENDLAPGDANFYFALAAMLAGGLYGVEHNATWSLYAATQRQQQGACLNTHALLALERSTVARIYLGDDFLQSVLTPG